MNVFIDSAADFLKNFIDRFKVEREYQHWVKKLVVHFEGDEHPPRQIFVHSYGNKYRKENSILLSARDKLEMRTAVKLESIANKGCYTNRYEEIFMPPCKVNHIEVGKPELKKEWME